MLLIPSNASPSARKTSSASFPLKRQPHMLQLPGFPGGLWTQEPLCSHHKAKLKKPRKKKPNSQYCHLYRLLKHLSHRAREYRCLPQAETGEGIAGGGGRGDIDQGHKASFRQRNEPSLSIEQCHCYRGYSTSSMAKITMYISKFLQ